MKISHNTKNPVLKIPFFLVDSSKSRDILEPKKYKFWRAMRKRGKYWLTGNPRRHCRWIVKYLIVYDTFSWAFLKAKQACNLEKLRCPFSYISKFLCPCVFLTSNYIKLNYCHIKTISRFLFKRIKIKTV